MALTESADQSTQQRVSACTIWFTGLSGTGKTTAAHLVRDLLAADGSTRVQVLDGDELRKTVCADLGYSKTDRDTNVRRIGALCQQLNQDGIIACAAVISPYEDTRQELRKTLPRFVLVHCTAPMEILVRRDPKGLYRRHRAGLVTNVTGVDDPYQAPTAADVVIVSDGSEAPEASASRVIATTRALGYLTPA